MNSDQERDFHLHQCEQCFQNAWTIINIIIDEQQKHDCLNYSNKLISPAFQFLLIEYSKPYTKSIGIYKKNYILSDEFIPSEYVDLHKKIITSRNQKHAHHDLTVLEAECIEGYDNMYIMNKSFPTEFLSQINSIKNLIEKSIDNMHKQFKKEAEQ